MVTPIVGLALSVVVAFGGFVALVMRLVFTRGAVFALLSGLAVAVYWLIG